MASKYVMQNNRPEAIGLIHQSISIQMSLIPLSIKRFSNMISQCQLENIICLFICLWVYMCALVQMATSFLTDGQTRGGISSINVLVKRTTHWETGRRIKFHSRCCLNHTKHYDEGLPAYFFLFCHYKWLSATIHQDLSSSHEMITRKLCSNSY